MSQLSNQFNIGLEKGQLTLMENKNLVSGKVADSEATPLVPGQAVKIADVAGSVINFTAAAVTDKIFGFVPFNVKKSSYAENEELKVAFSDCVMVMEAGAAVAAGASLEYVATGQKVITSAGTNTIIGEALTKAAADGDLILVLIKTPLVAQV